MKINTRYKTQGARLKTQDTGLEIQDRPIGLWAYKLIGLLAHKPVRLICLLCLASCVLSLASFPGCSQSRQLEPSEVVVYQAEQVTPLEMAVRFAPRLYTNPSEPYRIRDLIVFIHPEKPLIAYHLIWEDDSIGAGLGAESDHEIAWVEYDPISLKLVNFWVLWHRGILRTDQSVMDAKSHHQRPKIFVQWGQHGMLPVGWDKLTTTRPKAELRLHFAIAKSIQTGPYTGSKDIDSLKFQGNYSDYLTFSELLDSRQYICREKVVVGVDSNKIIPGMVSYTTATSKPPWPY